jgi:putative SOS response-associated peptidase YedK
MCGRFSQEAELSEIKLELKVEQLELFQEFRPLFNIGPSHGAGHEQAFVVQNREGQRALRQGRWWMIPHFWNKPLKELPAAFNARAEDLEAKPFWRNTFQRFRCLVPATGWREFKPEGKRKQPYQFRLERQVFAFAGLWSRWTSPDGEVVESFAIVTTAPNEEAAKIHGRMPLVMPPGLYDGWLNPQADAPAVLAQARLQSDALALDVYPSDPRGNDARFEGPEVVARFEPSTLDANPPTQPRKARPMRAEPTEAPSRKKARKAR